VTTSDPPPSDLQNSIYRKATRSRRQLTPLRRTGYRIAAPIAHGIVWLLWQSCRRGPVIGADHLDAAIRQHRALIPCYWHQHLLFCVRYLLSKRAVGLKVGFLISPSVDGEGPAMLARRLGGEVIRGSASHTGARALRDFYVAIAKEGVSPLITPDGPHGPAFVFKSGALMLSQLSGKPVVPIAYAASRATILKTWDRFVIPWPLARIALAIGEPITVPRVQTPAQMEDLQREMEQRLHALYSAAAASLEKKPGPVT
jgi:lysophospholipid acyltransferase (LPLAT)-like uncharacterized protein